MMLGSGIERFFAGVSALAVSPAVVVIACLYYWCFNKRGGFFIIASSAVGAGFNQLVKNTACVYRPWIRDARVVCSPLALSGATGYSFPSGHTVMAGTSGGFAAALAWRKSKAVAAAFMLYVLLVAFSRNFLCCHTPQDVLVALIEATVIVLILPKFLDWIDKRSARDIYALLLSVILTAAHLAYTILKPYPIDYVDGVLLVNPYEMQTDSFKAIGSFLGLVVGWFIERRCIKFTTDSICNKQRIVRAVIGLVVAGVVMLGVNPLFKRIISDVNWCGLVRYFMLFITPTMIVPALFCMERKLLQRATL